MHPFVIYVTWHPLFEDGKQYAASIYQTFNRNFTEPFSRGLGIPVYYRSVGVTGRDDEMPAAIDPAAAAHVAVVLLVDDSMVIHREKWDDYLQQLAGLDNGNAQLRIYPVAITKRAFSVSDVINDKNFIRVFEKETTEQKARFLTITLAHEFCRLILGFQRADDAKKDSLPRLKLFLSHSKADGVEITKLLKYWIQEFTGLQAFFDATDIPPGESFVEAINKGVGNSSLLVIQTDIFSTREWCRAEVLEAKKHNRPVVVVNALDQGEFRSFPYMSNVPVVRWKSENAAAFSGLIERIILAVLLETLRHAYQERLIDHQLKTLLASNHDYRLLRNAPELLDLVNTDGDSADAGQNYIYPDPPLGHGELQILKRCRPGATFHTPLQVMQAAVKEDTGHRKFTIGISISESGKMDQRGLSDDHLKDIMVEAARYLLASGYSLAYGGDIHYSHGFNFAMLLKEMVLSYRSDYKQNCVVSSYVCYPLYNLIDTAMEAELIDLVRFIRIPPPESLNIDIKQDWQHILKTETVNDQYLFSKCLTEMRMKMNAETDARIVLGGKLTGYKGRYPGLVEEVLLALKSDRPVFLIGAFGGCAMSIIEALQGSSPVEFTLEFQMRNPSYRNLVNYYQQQGKQADEDQISYDDLNRFFKEKGIAGLNNGLSPEENKVLFNSSDGGLIISLLLKGLRACYEKK